MKAKHLRNVVLATIFVLTARPMVAQNSWTNRYSGPGNGDDQATAIAVDRNGNVYVTGESYGTNGYTDYATIAYSSGGVALWTNRYNGPENNTDRPKAITVGPLGNVYVTGESYGSDFYADYATVAYTSAGAALWTNRYNGPGKNGDYVRAIAVSGEGKVYVTGETCLSASGLPFDYGTVAYSSAGVALWTNMYHSGPTNTFNEARAIAVDGSGNVYITGRSQGGSIYDYATLAYNSTGVALWTNRYSGPGSDGAKAIAVDGHGHVYVTGNSSSTFTSFPSIYDYVTVAYTSGGLALWTNRYNGPGNSNDVVSAMAVDKSGNVYVTGYSWGAVGSNDYATVAYTSAGTALWTNRYNGSGNGDDVANAIAVDGGGNVYVTGYSWGQGTNDYATVAYTSAGTGLWTNRYNGSGNGDDVANTIAVDEGGNVYVAGYSSNGTSYDYAVIKYAAPPAPQLAIKSDPGSSFVISYTGAFNYMYRLQRSSSLTDIWSDIATNVVPASGLVEFHETVPPRGQAFYRIAKP